MQNFLFHQTLHWNVYQSRNIESVVEYMLSAHRLQLHILSIIILCYYTIAYHLRWKYAVKVAKHVGEH